jgi:hypothetical protein
MLLKESGSLAGEISHWISVREFSSQLEQNHATWRAQGVARLTALTLEKPLTIIPPAPTGLSLRPKFSRDIVYTDLP